MKRLMGWIDRVVETVVIGLFAAMIAVGTAQVFNRYFLNMSLSWSEEFQRYGQIWLVFLAIPIAYRRGMHMGIEGLRSYLGESGRLWFARFIDSLWLVLGGFIAAGTSQFLGVLSTQRSAGLNLPMNWVYMGVLIGALYMILIGVRRLAASFADDAAINSASEG
uniref:TRAP transporter small permease n=1 Tax=Pararhizobium sp. IMCC3301 TaxID=3067904 RepID=UPI00274118FA|nr:TRAP transporter small permease [Pararhizobium sp. IMCC3301]